MMRYVANPKDHMLLQVFGTVCLPAMGLLPDTQNYVFRMRR